MRVDIVDENSGDFVAAACLFVGYHVSAANPLNPLQCFRFAWFPVRVSPVIVYTYIRIMSGDKGV